MSTARDRFQSVLLSNLENELFAFAANPNDPSISGGIFDTLLTALVDLAVDMLAKCMANRSQEQIAKGMANPGPLERWAIRNAVRQTEAIPKEQKTVCAKALTDTLKDTTPEDCVELIADTKAAIDWSIV